MRKKMISRDDCVSHGPLLSFGGICPFIFVHSFKDILILILSDIASLRKRNREDIVVTWSRRHCDADENNIDW